MSLRRFYENVMQTIREAHERNEERMRREILKKYFSEIKKK